MDPLNGLAHLLRSVVCRKVPRQMARTRVVRVGQQLLLTERGQCFQSIRLLFHGPSMARGAGKGSAQVQGVYA